MANYHDAVSLLNSIEGTNVSTNENNATKPAISVKLNNMVDISEEIVYKMQRYGFEIKSVNIGSNTMLDSAGIVTFRESKDRIPLRVLYDQSDKFEINGLEFDINHDDLEVAAGRAAATHIRALINEHRQNWRYGHEDPPDYL